MDAERRDEWKRADGDAEVERDLEVAEMFRTMTRDHQAQRRALLSWDPSASPLHLPARFQTQQPPPNTA